MKKRSQTLIVLVLVLLATSASAAALVTLDITRQNSVPLAPGTDTANTPILEIDANQQLPAGTTDVELATVTNNYDEPQTVTFDISNSPDMNFNSGDTKTITIQPNSAQVITVNTEGPQKTCAETTNRIQQDYTYESTSTTYSVSQTFSSVEVCRPGGGGGGGPPTGPPSNAEINLSFDGQVGNSNNRDYSWSVNPGVTGGSVDFYVNGNEVETGLPQEDSYRTKQTTTGDTVTVYLIDSNGNQVTSDSVSVP
jgi:hypothetical protein